MNKTAVFIILLFALSLFADVIDYVRIELLPVFDETGDYWGPYDYRWAYKVGNVLHVKSRASTVKRFLTFAPGDTIDESLVDESERRLRKTDFIEDAWITIIETDSGNTAMVIVRDLWTTKLSPSLSYKGKVLEWAVEAEEINLIGTGVGISGIYKHDEDYNSWGAGLKLPRMLPYKTTLSLYYSDATEIIGPTYKTISISRGRCKDSDNIIYSAGATAVGGEYPTWRDNNTAGPSYLADDYEQFAGAKYLFSHEFGFGIGIYNSRISRFIEENDFPENPAGYDRRLEVITSGISFLKREFTKLRDVDAFGRTEDIPTGSIISIDAGLGPKGSSPYASVFGVLGLKTGPIYHNSSFFYRRLNQTETSYVKYLFFSDKFLSSRLCGKFYLGRISNAPPESYYRVGGQSCLRSYRTYTQIGQNTVFANIESRIFTPVEILSIRIGGALFIDAGKAWDGPSLDFDKSDKPFIGDYGLELRFASTSSTTGQILRISLARTFEGFWEFELSSGQLFNSYRGLEHNIPLP